ncbi:hypothetical protein D5F11_010315 [Siminovitchia terrae]|uniref:HTH luxR-type domain-containing protein n=1 Tax=Siminovitchia terrae TaxID=1914933 RepID=A0A429X8S7_SIMTE|nr:LuxR C-terminal-related transcriptional regulator [Siminovitchia terrae]RST59796.1 hypothetical protein D5F11_010315 [Siminovitchia terrae]
MSDQWPLISTRLKMPQPRKNYILRNELFLRLNQMGNYSVILVKGGPGTGKTTLITSFAKEKAMANIRWISLDENCNHVFSFWNYFIEAISGDLGATKQDFLTLYDSNFQKSNFERLLTLLINGLDHQEELFIVLDDFYYMTDRFLLDTIEFFVKNMPDHVHLILLTREEPPLYLAMLNMEGRLLVIDENDLKLPPEQGIQFLKETLKLNMEQEILDDLNAISEGWIGGLQLIAAATGGKKQGDLIRINLQNKLVADYLTKEIYEALNPEEKEFLVMTSMLSYFHQEICIKVIEQIDFKKIIDSLFKKNILLTCIDEEKGIYRYHTIFKEYLNEKFNELNKETRIHFHLKAANSLKELGDFNQCIDHLLYAEDYIAAMKLILELPQNTALFSFMERIPEELLSKNPDFAFQRYFYHYVNMEFEKCREIYQLLKASMAKHSTYEAFKYANFIVEDRVNYNDIDVMSISEIDLLPLKETTKAFLLIKDATFLYVQNRYEKALLYIDQAINYSASRSNSYITFFSLSIKAQVLEDMGELNKCAHLYKKMERILESHESLSMLKASFYIGITGVYLKQMDLIGAESCLKQAADYSTDSVLPVDRGYRYNLTEYKFIREESEDAMDLVNELMNMESYHSPVYLAPLLDYVFRLNKNKLPHELLKEQFKLGYERMKNPFRSLENKLLYSKIIFHEGKGQAAMELTDEILTYSRKHKMKLMLIEASLFKIQMMIHHPGKKREVINLFREAVFYSHEDHILLPYYKEREVVAKLVRQYEQNIYSHLSTHEKAHYKAISKVCKVQMQSILSEREIEVLREIAEGSTNKEIADHLCISLATVKSHIINIYTKLRVNNRVAAIQASQKMGILHD